MTLALSPLTLREAACFVARYQELEAPFPWFGGKRVVTPWVWDAFGDVDHYVEPFAGSLAVLLHRPPRHRRRAETVNDADAFLCLAPDTRILRADLTWAKASTVTVGDELVGFDEHNGPAREGLRAPTRYRHWRTTAVTAIRTIRKPCYRLVFDDGTSITASGDHLWLGGSHAQGGRGWRWQKTSTLVCDRRSQRSWLLKLAPVVDREEGFEAGWLSGFYDGEGNLRSAPGWRVVVSQRPGPELDRAQRILRHHEFDVFRGVRSRVNPKHADMGTLEINGGMREVLRFLMLFRPERLIRNFQTTLPAMSLYGRQHQAVGLIEKEYLGERDVVAIETTSHTFIAEGLASHNCNFWRALKHDPVAVAEHADWPVNESDLFARHLWLTNTGRERIAQMEADPDFYDAKVAGWWVWGQCAWIGSGWCSGRGPWILAERGPQATPPGQRGTGSQPPTEHLGNAGQGVNRQLPHLGDAGRGVNRKRPHLGNAGQGVNRQLPHLGDAGRGVNRKRPHLGNAGQDSVYDYFAALAARLRRVRVCCGDWSRVVTDGALNYGATVGVLLDPPYLGDVRTSDLYRVDDHNLSGAVRDWALGHGDDPRYRIVLCGYEPEHSAHMPASWRVVAYSGRGAYGTAAAGANPRRHLERLWFSPHCLKPATQMALFEVPADSVSALDGDERRAPAAAGGAEELGGAMG